MRQKIIWKPPTITQLKLNFDGATRWGITAVGGVLRNDYGEALFVYFGNIDKGTNNMAEVMALFWGLQMINDMQIKEITIEVDSKVIIDMVKGISQPSWNLQNIITNIRQILKGMERVQLQHI